MLSRSATGPEQNVHPREVTMSSTHPRSGRQTFQAHHRLVRDAHGQRSADGVVPIGADLRPSQGPRRQVIARFCR